jgi:hypothetical protein
MVKLPHAEPGDQGTLSYVLKDREKLKEEDENSNTEN